MALAIQTFRDVSEEQLVEKIKNIKLTPQSRALLRDLTCSFASGAQARSINWEGEAYASSLLYKQCFDEGINERLDQAGLTPAQRTFAEDLAHYAFHQGSDSYHGGDLESFTPEAKEFIKNLKKKLRL